MTSKDAMLTQTRWPRTAERNSALQNGVQPPERAVGGDWRLWSSAGETSPFNVAVSLASEKALKVHVWDTQELLTEEQTSLSHGNELPILPGNDRTTLPKCSCCALLFILLKYR